MTVCLAMAVLTLTGCRGYEAQLPTSPISPTTGVIGVGGLPQPHSLRAIWDWSRCELPQIDLMYNFNVFVSGDFVAPSSDTEGRLAAGGNVFLSNYSVGDKLPYDTNRADLVVGGNLEFRSGAVMTGATTYAGSLFRTEAATSFGGFHNATSVIDFGIGTRDFLDLSLDLGTLKTNGTTTLTGEGSRHFTTLVGTHNVANVFAMSTLDLQRTHTMEIQAPASSSVIVNVYGETAVMSSFAIQLSGVSRDRVIFNFVDATRLTISHISVEGSVLAPRAVVTFPSGQLNGHFVAAKFYGAGQFNHVVFSGCIPRPDKPSLPPSPTPSPTPTPTPGETPTPTPTPSASPTPAPTPTSSPTPGPTPSGGNCTHSTGFWKTHAGSGSQPDLVTPLLPISLGAEYVGSRRLLVTTNSMAVDVLNQDVYGNANNGITKLYAQLLATKLNVKKGANIQVVNSSITRADDLLALYNFNDWLLLSLSIQPEILELHAIFESYNTGQTGPGKCY